MQIGNHPHGMRFSNHEDLENKPSSSGQAMRGLGDQLGAHLLHSDLMILQSHPCRPEQFWGEKQPHGIWRYMKLTHEKH
jgi:hypothetical protein